MVDITREEFETLKMDHETLKGNFNELCIVLQDLGLKQRVDFESLQAPVDEGDYDPADDNPVDDTQDPEDTTKDEEEHKETNSVQDI